MQFVQDSTFHNGTHHLPCCDPEADSQVPHAEIGGFLDFSVLRAVQHGETAESCPAAGSPLTSRGPVNS